MTYKNPTAAVQCDYNISILVLQEFVKTQHPGNLTTSDLYYKSTAGFHSWENPACCHTSRAQRLQFRDVIVGLVIFRLSRSLVISHSSRARDLVTIVEVDSRQVPSLERITTGVGSASGTETEKLNSLGISSRPSWQGLSVSLLSNTGFYC